MFSLLSYNARRAPNGLEGNCLPSPVWCPNGTTMGVPPHGIPVRRLGSGPKGRVIADSKLLDAWIRQGGQINAEMLRSQGIITQSEKLLAELNVSQQTLREGLRSLKEQISSLRAARERLRKARSRPS